MLCLSGFELYSRWVPLIFNRLPKRIKTLLNTNHLANLIQYVAVLLAENDEFFFINLS